MKKSKTGPHARTNIAPVQRTSRCFNYQKDNLASTNAAHKHPMVQRIAKLVLAHPDLLEDLSLMILRSKSVQLPDLPPVSSTYRKIKARDLRPEEELLALYLDGLYEEQDPEMLSHLRGVVLERIVLEALRSRVRQWDVIEDNISHIAPPGRNSRPISGYPVDVAGCFPRLKRAEFYACKLISSRFELSDVEGLDLIGSKLTANGAQAVTGLCCMDQEDSVDEDLLDLLDQYPWVDLYTTDNLLELAHDTDDDLVDTEAVDR